MRGAFNTWAGAPREGTRPTGEGTRPTGEGRWSAETARPPAPGRPAAPSRRELGQRRLGFPRFALFLLLALLLGGLERVAAQIASSPPGGPGASTNAAAAPKAALPGSLAGYVSDDKYKLRIGDQISLQITEDGDPPRGFQVNDSGEINFPYVGRWSVKDKTCKELADLLKVELEKEYYHQATPIIALEAANPVLGKIYFQGQVRSTGPMDLYVNEPLTVGKAILRAGGFSEFANKKKVKLMRGSDKENQPRQFYELDMDEILEQGKTEKDMTVQPDDFILVPSRIFKF